MITYLFIYFRDFVGELWRNRSWIEEKDEVEDWDWT